MTFGQTIYLSQIVTTAMTEPGVTGVSVLRFQRYGKPEAEELSRGRIDFGPLDIPLLDDRAVNGVQGILHVRAEAEGDQ